MGIAIIENLLTIFLFLGKLKYGTVVLRKSFALCKQGETKYGAVVLRKRCALCKWGKLDGIENTGGGSSGD